MSVKILEDASFGILRTNPKITGNVKVVVDSSNNTFIESISANDELSKSKYKAVKTSASSGYQFDIARVFGNTPTDIFFDVKKPSSDYSVYDNYGFQYDLDYCYGTYSINSQSYKEEFGVFAPIWLENNLPDYFVIFRVDGPVTVNNKNAATENQNKSIVNDPLNFKELFLSKSKIIKTFDLRSNTNIGRYIRNFRSAEGFPVSSINFTTRSDQGTYWNGISVDKPGGFTSKSENIYSTLFVTDRTILENDYFITGGFERNRLTAANIINFEFLFDDPDAKPFEINRYFGVYVNAIDEGTFRLDSSKFYLRAQADGQTAPVGTNTFVANNEKSYTVTNKNGVKLYVDDLFTTTNYNIPINSGLDPNSFIPSFSDVNQLNSIFYVKDRNGDFHNLNYTNSWLSDEVRLQETSIDIKDFTGFEEVIITTRGIVPDKASKASTFIEVLLNPLNGDSYVAALPKKQTYVIDVVTANAGDTITIQDSSTTSVITFTLSSSNEDVALSDIEYNIDISNLPVFERYETSIRNGVLILTEKVFTCVDDDFEITTSSSATNIVITKQVASNLYENTISADPTIATVPGTAVGLVFNNNGTVQEVAKAMAAAFNNIKERLFESVSVDNKVVIIAKVAGPRFNDLVVGKDLFLSSSNSTKLITDKPAFFNPNFILYYFQGGTNNPSSKSIIDINLFSTFKVANRYLRTTSDKNVSETLSKVLSVFYYTDEEIRDKNGVLTGFKNFDKYCVVAINDKYSIYRDSMGSIYLYELFDIPFGRFSIFPIKVMDFDYLSTEYGDEKELNTEKEYYSTFTPSSISTQEDIEEFYNTTGFTSLLSTLDSEVSSFLKGQDAIASPTIESEYDRLKENTLTDTSTPSRTVPYINKWVYRNGKNVRETDYRLTTSEAFGLTNFSPSAEEKDRNTNYFTHEWYYLQKLPKFYGLFNTDKLDKVFSYFPEPIDVTATGLLDVNNDYFTEYFTVDYLKYPLIVSAAAAQPFTVDEEIPYAIKKQFRYSLFEGASSQNFATTLFRGVKVIVKERVENQQFVNYDVSSIKTKYDKRYNGYKFSCVLIPHDGTYDGVKRKTIEYEFIENRKNKCITFLIFLKIDDILNGASYLDPTNPAIINIFNTDFIDRTILYALKSKVFSIDPNNIPLNNYSDIILSGSVNASGQPVTIIQPGQPNKPMKSPFVAIGSSKSYLAGVNNSIGQETLFTEEILINKNGNYNDLIVAPVASFIKTYRVSGVYDNSRLGILDEAVNLPSPDLYVTGLSQIAIENGTYTYVNGGFGFWTNRLNKVSFGYIQDLINQGDPSIKYTTILENGSIQNNLFLIELQTANYTMKSNYLKPYEVINRSNVSTDLSTLVGNKLDFSTDSKISPIYRHGGYYQPKFNDVIDFVDPYTIDLDLLPDSREYLVKQKMKDKNTQFMLTSTFGSIPNFYLHKVNDINPASVIQLSEQSSFLPVYPLSGQIAIDYKNFYTFKTNWDASYFEKYFEKGTKTDIVGTRGVVEKRSFFGSKVMKIQDSVTVETFNGIRANSEAELASIGADILKPDNPYQLAYYEDKNKFILDVYLDKRLVEVISSLGVYSFFNNYINPKYGFGNEEGITDDVNSYIQVNLLPRYLVGGVQLYVLKSGNVDLNATYPVINSGLTDAQKIINGYKVDNNVQFMPLPGINNFNLRLIYNKTAGYQYSIAPSFRVNKK